ncbi:MAG: selenocysteine-specific translation elongation factor [Chthoniobacterales bacterium]
MKHLILATAGHVDHGKTALIKALTGIDTDRLPEEKARGITIELGFAHLQLGDVSLGVIDVPGHEDFVKNMVAGVGAIDLALIVVAADDGWMPQTEEHLQILEYLGVQHAVIAQTKIDLATAREDLRTQLMGSAFADAPIVSVSVRTGEGIAELKEQLANACKLLPSPRDFGKPRLAVDRAFVLRGIGPVVTGTLSGGKLQRGDAIIVQPSGTTGRIRALQTHNREVEESVPGMRTALSIPGVEIRRGEMITRAEFGAPSSAIDALVRRSARLPVTTSPLKHGATVRVHHGSANSSARIFFANEEKLGAGQSAIAQLRFEEPIFVFAGDRFILRDASERHTLAGALVLDPDANARRFRTTQQQTFLAARAAAPESAEVFLRTQVARDHAVRRSTLLAKSRFSGEDFEGAGEFLIEEKWWRKILERAVSLIDAEHKAYPNLLGLELARLREAISELPFPELFEKLTDELCVGGFAKRNELIHRIDHRATLPPPLHSAGERIRAALAAKPFDPPSRKELAPDAISQQALRFLRETKEAVEISAEVILAREALELMRSKVVAHLRSHDGATVSDLRLALGSSRRVVVPLLEYFDRAGLTRRVGDKRALASAR